MSGTLLCVLAFLTTLAPSIANWRIGLCVLMAWGYFFGILKAHYVQSWGHFIFDAATVGFYTGLLINLPSREEQSRWQNLLPWAVLLMAWPIFMALIPLQHYLVQLVGLRGNMFWIPMLMIGAILDGTGRKYFALSLAVLNMVAFGFALGEYFLGVEMFVPENEVTRIVFNSNDVAGGNKRIPSIFANAHSYAGTMVGSIPWLLGEILIRNKFTFGKSLAMPLLVSGLIAALLGVFIAGPRSPIVILFLMLGLILFSGRLNIGFLVIVILAGSFVAYFVAENERMQRFAQLQDLEMVQERIAMSLNMTFFEVLFDYPMGNGMGAGGTSLPFFAEQLLTQRIMIENEYARILLEQGLPGLIFFLAFVGWFFTRKISVTDDAVFGKTLIWFMSAVTISTAWIGIGMMTSIPGAAMLLLGMGYCVTAEQKTKTTTHLGRVPLKNQSRSNLPAYQLGLSRT